MKTQRTPSIRRGFTLMELIVAMAITTIIVTVLVSITSMALDTWNRSRSELRASRQAKSMIDTMARDFESLVTRKGNTSEWLSAITPANQSDLPGDKFKSTNAAKLIFVSAATDRYDGKIYGEDGVPDNPNNPGGDDPAGGDVSCVAYELIYKDPIGGSASDLKTFVMSRLIVDPDDVFRDMLVKSDLLSTLSIQPTPPTPPKPPKKTPKDKKYSEQLSDSTNYLCENIYQFTLTFHVQVTDPISSLIKNVPVTMSSGQTTSFRILGTGIVTVPVNSQVASGRVTAVEISVTVLSDFGVDQQRTRFKTNSPTSAELADSLAKHSYNYTKLVQLPTM